MGNRPTKDSALPKKVQCRSLCVTPNGFPPNLCQLETWSGCYRIWCNDFWLVPSKRLRFPPFSLIAPVLKNISQDKRDLVLVAPVWQAQPWWQALLNLLIKNPIMIPNSKHLLRDLTSPLSIHPVYPRLHLAVFPYQGTASNRRVFQRTLPQFSNQQLVPSHIRQTSQPNDYGIAGVLNEKLIQFLPPWMMSSSSWPIAFTTEQPIDQSMWHVQLYPSATLRLRATLLGNILLLFNFKKECLTQALQNRDIPSHGMYIWYKSTWTALERPSYCP